MKIALLGYGKMGRAIERIALAQGHEIVLRLDSRSDLNEALPALAQADVAIEFSRPETAFQNVKTCLEAGVPVVCGTTGWNDHLEEARLLCGHKNGTFFYASNFSVGVYLFMEINRRLAQLMNPQGQYDLHIEETHHIHKLDAPSGTAVTLAETILPHLDAKTHWAEGESSDPAALPILSHRVDEVPGTHTVTYRSAIDAITLTHEAYSREGFAAGALQAAIWVVGRRGCFGMGDMLGNQ